MSLECWLQQLRRRNRRSHVQTWTCQKVYLFLFFCGGCNFNASFVFEKEPAYGMPSKEPLVKSWESGPVLGWQGQESWYDKYTTVRSTLACVFHTVLFLFHFFERACLLRIQPYCVASPYLLLITLCSAYDFLFGLSTDSSCCRRGRNDFMTSQEEKNYNSMRSFQIFEIGLPFLGTDAVIYRRNRRASWNLIYLYIYIYIYISGIFGDSYRRLNNKLIKEREEKVGPAPPSSLLVLQGYHLSAQIALPKN